MLRLTSLRISGASVAYAGAVLTMLGGAPMARAQYLTPTPYLSFADSPFANLPFNTFANETFEDGLVNAPGLTAFGGRLNIPSQTTDSVDGDSGPIDGLGRSGRSWYSGGNNPILEFRFAPVNGMYPTHAGLVWTDVGITTFGGNGFGRFTLQAFDQNLQLIDPVLPNSTVGDGLISGETGEDRFFGIVHAPGISRIQIIGFNSTDFEVDHVQFGVIPTPSTLALVVAAGFVGSRRRR